MKIAFFRTNFFWYAQQSGGSVSHIAGFTDGMNNLNQELFFVSTDKLVKIDEAKNPVYVIHPSNAMKRLPYLGELFFNSTFWRRSVLILKQHPVDVIYQRHSAMNCSGALAAQALKLPLVLEYNSPEGWKLRHWTNTTPLKRPLLLLLAAITTRMENYSLEHADGIIVVSEALRQRLLKQGIPNKKILVNPNGVELEPFDAVPVVKKYAKPKRILIGFVGTFAHWHGAEILCRAVKAVVDKHPDAHFVLMGDGVYRQECEQIIADAGMEKAVTFTGTIPHDEAIGIMKACDLLVSPHVPNKDGSPFFGSPTKLFEYMAAGKCLIASDLDQVGQIVRETQSGVLVKPGDAQDLARGINEAIDDPKAAAKMGTNGRRAVEKDYTWTANAKRALELMKGLVK